MRFPSFMPSGRQVCDAKAHTEVLLALSCESIEEVDGWVERAGDAGGSRRGV
jgi:predicted lactoylglutathione lyase